MAEEKREVHITLKCQVSGYGFDLSVDCLIDHIPALVHKLEAVGVAPANSPYVWSQQPAPVAGGAPEAHPPVCPVHHVVMKPSRHGAGWYCSAVVGTGADGQRVYCKEKAS